MPRSPETTGSPYEAWLGELRAPLDSILAYVELLLEEELSEYERRCFLEVIHKSAKRVRGAVDDGRPSVGRLS